MSLLILKKHTLHVLDDYTKKIHLVLSVNKFHKGKVQVVCLKFSLCEVWTSYGPLQNTINVEETFCS